MRNKLLVIAVVALCSSLSMAAEPAKPTAPVAHASPETVYKVYREACFKRDWRTIWSCLTVERQKYELFECYFGSQTKRETPQLTAMLKKHGLETEHVNAEVVRVYEQTHRVKYTPDAKLETELLYEVVFNLVTDKPGFYEDICNYILEPGPHKIAELKHVILQEDAAVGHTTTLISGLEAKAGQPSKKFEHVVPKEINFAKVNGGWLIGP